MFAELIHLGEKFIEGGVSEIGREFLLDVVGASAVEAGISAAERYKLFVETMGVSEIEHLGLKGLDELMIRPSLPEGGEYLRKLQEYIQQFVEQLHPENVKRRFKWQRGGWAKTRQEWLDKGWLHDWRSQPRDAAGKWIPGRLDHMVQVVHTISRRARRLMGMRRRYRRRGAALARAMISSSWSVDDGN